MVFSPGVWGAERDLCTHSSNSAKRARSVNEIPFSFGRPSRGGAAQIKVAKEDPSGAELFFAAGRMD
jgi:hypothetical protein